MPLAIWAIFRGTDEESPLPHPRGRAQAAQATCRDATLELLAVEAGPIPEVSLRADPPFVVLGNGSPADGPVLSLHLVAPAECTGDVVELSRTHRAVVDEPYDRRAVST